MNDKNSDYIKFLKFYFDDEVSIFKKEKLNRFAQFIIEKYPNVVHENHKLTTISKQISFLEYNKINFLKELGGEHIPVLILLKSSALNGHYFRNNKMRGSSDLDILVDVNEYTRLKSILSKRATPIKKSGGPLFDIYEETWYSKKYNCYIDLHFHLLNPLHFNISTLDIVNNSTVFNHLNIENIRVPCLEHMIIHLCLHFIKDGNYSSQSIFDYLYLKKYYNLDYEIIDKYTKVWDCKKAYRLSEKLIYKKYITQSRTNIIDNYTMANNPGSKVFRLARYLSCKNFILNIIVYFSRLLCRQ